MSDNLHDHHRKRMKQRFLETDGNGFSDHELLELLLYYSIPRRDTNQLAHEIFDSLGNLKQIFDAPESEFLNSHGVGENTLVLMKLMKALCRRYYELQTPTIGDSILFSDENFCQMFVPKFLGRTTECVYLSAFDNRGIMLDCSMIHEGSINSTEINPRKIISHLMKFNATAAVIAHNHPLGHPLPSQNDLLTTETICESLKYVDITLLDHIIVSGSDAVSLSASGYFNSFLHRR